MITLSNGHSFDYAAAAGSLGFDGRGYWWEWPWRWLGYLDPGVFTIITKTLTFRPRKGNYRWYCPWRAVWPIRQGWVNAMGLPNPGYCWWLDKPLKQVERLGYKVIVSLAPEDEYQAKMMATLFNGIGSANVVGIELNLSCPNVEQGVTFSSQIKLVQAFSSVSRLPVIVKLSYGHCFHAELNDLEPLVEAFDCINSVPWNSSWYNFKPSPLRRFGGGGISGKCIDSFAQTALGVMKNRTNKPILSGGGITTLEEAMSRLARGADAISFGTLFLDGPWKPNQIVRALEYHKEVKGWFSNSAE